MFLECSRKRNKPTKKMVGCGREGGTFKFKKNGLKEPPHKTI
jgi:hypothetical protein